MNYIRQYDIAKNLGVKKGDRIFISSDTRKLLLESVKNEKTSSLDNLINGFKEEIGEMGTLVFPTYNWGFCNGEAFDYKRTPCMTGQLGAHALTRSDFKRSAHPIYSFAVWGKDQEKICSMKNKSSFGSDSPFAFFHHHSYKNVIIDVTLQHCFTFAHYVEEMSGVRTYRYIKEFSSKYINEYGDSDYRTYSMLVRDEQLNVQVTIDPIEERLVSEGAEIIKKINHSEYKILNLPKVYDIMMDDIVNNASRNLTKYDGQE